MEHVMRRMKTVVAVLALALPVGAAPPSPKDKEAGTQLFNGKDLAGWETWLAKPNKLIEVPGHPKNENGEYTGPVGLNKDPKGVFSVVQVDGKPAIRISGEIFGALTTLKEYDNYHLSFEFKWGEKKWPPRDQRVRDSGCLYHCVGPHGAGGGSWMKSFESQIQEKDCGDFWSVAGVIADVEGVPKEPNNPESEFVYKKGATKMVAPRRVIKDPDNERPTGEWNTMEIYAFGQTSAHVVNGKVNMILTGLRHKVDGQEVPLTRGKIQFQSEGAEVFYRNIVLRPITGIPRHIVE